MEVIEQQCLESREDEHKVKRFFRLILIIIRTIPLEIYAWTLFCVRYMPGWIGIYVRRFMAPLMFGIDGRAPHIETGVRIEHSRKLKAGKNLRIAERTVIWADGEVEIGDHVMIGPHCKIYSSRHSYEDPNCHVIDQEGVLKKTIIEDDVWFGAGVVVQLGVTIGKGAVISAGAVVGRSIPPYAVVAGNPSRVVGWRGEQPKDQPMENSKNDD